MPVCSDSCAAARATVAEGRPAGHAKPKSAGCNSAAGCSSCTRPALTQRRRSSPCPCLFNTSPLKSPLDPLTSLPSPCSCLSTNSNIDSCVLPCQNSKKHLLIETSPCSSHWAANPALLSPRNSPSSRPRFSAPCGRRRRTPRRPCVLPGKCAATTSRAQHATLYWWKLDHV